MTFNKESAAHLRPNQPAIVPEAAQIPFRSVGVLLADELSNAADLIKWPRMPELREFEQMAGLIAAAGQHTAGERTGASAPGPARFYKAPADGCEERAKNVIR